MEITRSEVRDLLVELYPDADPDWVAQVVDESVAAASAMPGAHVRARAVQLAAARLEDWASRQHSGREPGREPVG